MKSVVVTAGAMMSLPVTRSAVNASHVAMVQRPMKNTDNALRNALTKHHCIAGERMMAGEWSTVSESRAAASLVSESVGSRVVWVVKPRRAGGPAFWRALWACLKPDIREFKVKALQLHSKAYLYIIEGDILRWIYNSILAIKLTGNIKIDYSEWCSTTKCKEYKVVVKETKVKKWWGKDTVKYLEITEVETGKKTIVYRNASDKWSIESSHPGTTDSETAYELRADSETERSG